MYFLKIIIYIINNNTKFRIIKLSYHNNLMYITFNLRTAIIQISHPIKIISMKMIC